MRRPLCVRFPRLVLMLLWWVFPCFASAEVSRVDLSGEINKEFYFEVELAIRTHVEEIHIESSGGGNVWALQAANALNNQDLTQLVVVGKCVSACASLAFATDNLRITEGAFIAVHRTSLGMKYVLSAGEFDLGEERFEALNFYAAEESRLLQQAGRTAAFFEQAMREIRPVCYGRLITTDSGLVAGYLSRAEAHYWMPDEDVFNHYRGIDVSGDWPDSGDLFSNKEAFEFIEKYRVVRTASVDELNRAPIETFGECQK